MSIPKILHYCWFGYSEMPKTEKKCVERWKKYFSNFEIIKWDENNFDIHCNKYVEQAYQAKRFAFVADYVRLLALYQYGGVYLDADCYVKKNFEPLLFSAGFTGFGGDNKEIAACTLGFEKAHPFIKECLESYQNDLFLDDDKENLESINIRMTKLLMKHGFKPNGKMQEIEGIIIYPMTYFCPLSMLPDTVPDCKSRDTFSMPLWTNPELKRERSLIVRMAHKTKLNELKRKLLKR